MQYIVVEVKDKDLYTIYDVENKGVCCCSTYTIRQLLESGCQVLGAEIKNNRLIIKEMSLDGKIRTNKAPEICTNTTKRSATTIMRGLDEKHYPRVIHKRTVDSNVYNIEDAFVLHTNGKVVLCVKCTETDFITENFEICKFSKFPINAFGEKYKLKSDFCKALVNYYKEQTEYIAVQLQIKQLQDAQIHKQNQINVIKSDLKKRLTEIKFNVQLDEKMKEVSGNEEFNMSFYNGTLNIVLVCAVILKTKKPIRYTYGLSYRNPTTNKVLITKESAINHVRTGGNIDVRATTDTIYINEYSANDMW